MTRIVPVLLAALTLPGLARAEDAPPAVAPFAALKERNGGTVSLADLRGKVWVASFLVTRCPDGKCPQVAQTIQRLQKEMAARPDLLFVTFTTDPTRDDPDELKRYAEKFGADPKRWLFLTGSEEQIDELLRSFYFRKQDEEFKKGRVDHSQKLVLVDRQGGIRDYFDGLDSPELPAGYFEDNLRRLKRAVSQALQPELPAWMPTDFPLFNATLNALSGALVLLGYLAVRLRWVRLHAACMLTAIAVSGVFLSSYLFYHIVVKQGQPTRFADQWPQAPAWVGWVYYAILGTHTLLAIPVAPLALVSAYLGLRGRIAAHLRLVRWTLPMWVYVSVTGVVVYWMLYRLYPA